MINKLTEISIEDLKLYTDTKFLNLFYPWLEVLKIKHKFSNYINNNLWIRDIINSEIKLNCLGDHYAKIFIHRFKENIYLDLKQKTKEHIYLILKKKTKKHYIFIHIKNKILIEKTIYDSIQEALILSDIQGLYINMVIDNINVNKVYRIAKTDNKIFLVSRKNKPDYLLANFNPTYNQTVKKSILLCDLLGNIPDPYYRSNTERIYKKKVKKECLQK